MEFQTDLPTSASRPIESTWTLARLRLGRWTRVVLATAAAFAVGAGPWYLSQFPGVITWDSWDQLAQIHGWKPLSPYHSLFQTALIWGLGKSPGLYVFLQYVGFSLAIGFSFTLAANGFSVRHPAPSWKAPTIAALACGLLPTTGVYAAWIIKDVPYAGAVLVAGSLWAVLLSDRVLTLGRAVGLGISAAVPWLFRHDGGVVIGFFLAIGAMVAWRARNPKWLAAVLAGVLVIAGFSAGLTRFLKVGRDWKLDGAWSIAFVHDVAGMLQRGESDEDDRRFVRQWGDPVRLSAEYVHARGDVFFWRKDPLADLRWLAEHKREFLRGYLRLAQKNVLTLLEMRWIRFGHHIGLRQLDVTADWLNCDNEWGFHVTTHPWAIKLRKLVEATDTPRLRLVFWCSLWPLLVLLAIATSGVIRRHFGLAIFSGLPLLYLPILTLIAHGPTFRYNYYLLPLAVASILAMRALMRRTRGA